MENNMTTSIHIDVSIDDYIMSIKINRPEKKNAINQAMYEVMSSALVDADARDDVRAIVLLGVEGCFTAGNDLADFNTRKPTGLTKAAEFLLVLHDLKKPLIAAVSGLAVGIGTTLLLHCDLVYAADDTRFRLPFVNLGLCPEAGSSLMLPAISGHRSASELLLLGGFFDSEMAIKTGLVNQAMPDDQLLNFAFEQAKQLALQPAEALLETKCLLKSGSYEEVKQRILDESEVFSRLLQNDESKVARQRATAGLGRLESGNNG
jgi:enoyl-CoA hydratase/carnithine racemase